MSIRLLVTDGANKNTLAVLRALGREHRIDVVSHQPRGLTLASYSRFCGRTIRVRTAASDLDAYAAELLGMLAGDKYAALIPVGLQSCLAVSRRKADFEKLTGVAIADWEPMQVAYDRDRAMRLAASTGVPIPRTYRLTDAGSLDAINAYPVVLKANHPRGDLVRYCNDRREIEWHYAEVVKQGGTGAIAQEYVRGFGCGFYGIYDHGTLAAHFMHRRIKEFPITGGPSAVAESCFDGRLFEYGRRLCDALRWHGPIMAEFKYDSLAGDYRLIEINPKLWGSLDLTIEAGVNVPGMLLELAQGKRVKSTGSYSYLKYRWVFPGELKVLLCDRSFSNLKSFFAPGRDVRTNIWMSDPCPTAFQMVNGLAQGGLAMVSARRRYPHGKIRA